MGARLRAVRDEQQPRQHDEVRDDARTAVADERQRDPGQRDHPQHAADDDERLQGEAEREAHGEELREAVLGENRRPEAAQAEHHEDEQEGGDAHEAQLLGERGEDEVRVEVRDVRHALGACERPPAQPGAAEAPVPDRIERLRGLIAGTVRVGPGIEPRVDARRDPADGGVRERRAAREQQEAGGHEERTPRGHVEHGQEDPEVEERAAEVVRLDDDQHRRAEEQEQRPEILEPRLREQLTLLAEIRGQEHDEEHFRQLAGLEAERPDVDPEPGAVDRAPDHRQRGQREQDHRRHRAHVLVALDPAVVATEDDQHRGHGDHADHDPRRLAQRVGLVDAVDLRHADRRQQRDERQQVRVRVRHREAQHEVGCEIEAEEEDPVGERRPFDDVLAGDVDAREAEARDGGDDDQAQELPVPVAHGTTSRANEPTSRMAALRLWRSWSKSSRRSSCERFAAMSGLSQTMR